MGKLTQPRRMEDPGSTGRQSLPTYSTGLSERVALNNGWSILGQTCMSFRQTTSVGEASTFVSGANLYVSEVCRRPVARLRHIARIPGGLRRTLSIPLHLMHCSSCMH